MRLPSVPSLSVVEHLNTAYFDRVWNATDDHGAANFALSKAAQRLQVGAIPINQSVVGLPTTDKVYAVYRVTPRVFGRFLSFPDHVWVKDTDLLLHQSVTVSTYASSGRVIPFGNVYFKYDSLRAMVLIAIDRTYTSQCIGEAYPELYMTVYKDTSRESPVTTQVFQISSVPATLTTSQTILAAITASKNQYPAGTIVYVNGWMYDPNALPSLHLGDVISLVTDPDIVGYCDLTVDDAQTGYYSVLYGEYREILHIPKILNPNNYVLTNDTLLIGIFDTQSNKGVLGHRLDPHALESVTHNDFSMSRTVLQAFQNSLSTQSIKVRLYIRFSTRPLVLGEDANHLSDLYTLSDADIKLHLIGLSPHQILEWKAANLEQSTYLDLLYNFDGFGASNILAKYADAMGYYDVASKLSQTIHTYVYEGAEVEIQKPTRLIGYPCHVIVYANGRKIPSHMVSMTNYTNHSFLLGFSPWGYIVPDTKITVYIAEGNLRETLTYFPTVVSPSIVTDSEDYALVKIVTYQTPKQVWKATTSNGYYTIPLSPGDYHTTSNSDGTVTYTVSSIHYGQAFYLVPRPGMTTTEYSLDTLLNNHESIIIPLQTYDQNNTLIPLIGLSTVEIYINGYRLIEGLDYTYTPILGDNADTLQTLLEVSNLEYIDLANVGNVLEVVVHGDSVVSFDKGYVISNLMHRQLPPMIWSKSCGRAFARGLLIEDVREVGNTVISSQSIADGSPYLLEWTIPYGVSKLMKGLSPVSDINLRTKIDHVLNLVAPGYPDTVLISNLYALYSPYLAKIVKDVADGTFSIIDDPKDDLFLEQFFDYALLYPRDPILLPNNSLLDRRFITLAVHYVNLSVSNPQQMILVQRLVNLLLRPSLLSIEEVLI